MKSSKTRLQLNRETLRRLDENELTAVVGGTGGGDPIDPDRIVRRTDTCPTSSRHLGCPDHHTNRM